MKNRLFSLTLGAMFLLFSFPLAAFAVSGDLAISDGDISFNTSTFYEGRSVRITAIAHNNSPNDLLGSIRVNDGKGAVASDQPISALAGQTDAVFVDWTPPSYGTYTLTITLIPWDASQDNPGNNVVTKTVTVLQDSDHDGLPNSTDPDDDNDGVNDGDDQFPLDGRESVDTDGDGKGDNADTDDDNDGVLDADDGFPLDPTYWADQDKDGTPDENDDDLDGDQLSDDQEEDLGTDPKVSDTDTDGVTDGVDAFPLDSKEQKDSDGDGTGDNSDDDMDGDGTANADDVAPGNPAPRAETNRNVYFASVDQMVVFSAVESQDDGTITEYIWNFGDKTLTGAEVSYSYAEKGMRSATLTVLDDSGQSDTVEFKVKVIDYGFLAFAILFSLLLILLAFYLIYRYTRGAQKAKPVPTKPSKRKKSR